MGDAGSVGDDGGGVPAFVGDEDLLGDDDRLGDDKLLEK